MIEEKSPYLQQHARNPVEWYPWCGEAFEKAERENKPVFLSVGYSTCHWCHVMEKECFEDEEVAALLNRHYVSIKVDREERPDVDDVYMKAAVLLGQQGGWPLSIIMTPERIPFFAGTYIPKYNRYHIVGMMNLLEPLAEHFRSNSKELQEVIEAMRTQSKRLVPSLVSENESAQPELVYQGLMQYFDPKNGGFGQGMKFPRSHQLWYLLTHYRQTGEADALEAVKRTLLNIRRGGIFDQLGFGVHRYSVDDEWFVPHFEKMLYNQAQLSLAALRYYEITGEHWAETMGREIFTYVLRDMTSPEGGFYSAEDADSEGEEGAFYLWEHQEIEETLSPREFELFRIVFPIERNGNWTDPSVREQRPTNILRISESGEALMSEMSQEESQTLKAACAKLLARRSHRPRPELDDKILTDWNGLMIVSMAEGGRILKEASYLDAAKRAFRFIRDKLHVEDKLFHRYRDGETAIAGHLSDHVFLAWGGLALYQTTFELEYLQEAVRLMEIVRRHFKYSGEGFLMTPESTETFYLPPINLDDMAEPSGNSVALLLFSELGRLLGNTSFEAEADELEALYAPSFRAQPDSRAVAAMAIARRQALSSEVVLVDPGKPEETLAFLREIEGFLEGQLVRFLIKRENESESLAALAPLTAQQTAIDGKPTAYLCRGNTCLAPVTSLSQLKEQMTTLASMNE